MLWGLEYSNMNCSRLCMNEGNCNLDAVKRLFFSLYLCSLYLWRWENTYFFWIYHRLRQCCIWNAFYRKWLSERRKIKSPIKNIFVLAGFPLWNHHKVTIKMEVRIYHLSSYNMHFSAKYCQWEGKIWRASISKVYFTCVWSW